MNEPLEFWAEVIRIKTMADNSIRLELSLPEDMTALMGILAECKRRGAVLEIVAKPTLTDFDDETKKSAKRRSIKTDR